MNERAPAIEIHGLAKFFGDNRVLSDVDLSASVLWRLLRVESEW